MILVENKVVIAVCDTFEQLENGKLINGCIWPMGDIVDVTPPDHVIGNTRWCYEKEKGFYENPAWLQSTGKVVQDAIDAYNLELIELGVM